MPLSITTAGRDVAGSMRMRMRKGKNKMLVLEVDLQLRSEREFRAEDHGQEERFEKRKDE